MKQKSNILILFALLLCLPEGLYAKFGEKSRYEIGYSYVMATGNFKGNVGIYDNSSWFTPVADTFIERSLTAKVGFGGYVGLNFPLKRLGRRSTLALSTALVESGYIWGDLNSAYGLDGSFTNEYFQSSMSGVTIKVGIAVGLDVKSGTDALCRRNPHVGFTFGAGVIPQINMTVLDATGGADFGGGTTFGVMPYTKAEISFFTGFCWKIKAMASFGKINLIDEKNPLTVTAIDGGKFQVNETSNISLHLTVLPFSFFWKKTRWWNDYETRKPYY